MSNNVVANTSNDTLHTVRASFTGHAFIVSSPEAKSLLKRIDCGSIRTQEDILQGATPSIGSLIFHKDLILVPRHKMTSKQIRLGYKSLQVLKETDAYVWYCRKELFKDTVISDGQFYQEFTQQDQDILDGNIPESLSNKLAKNRKHEK